MKLQYKKYFIKKLFKTTSLKKNKKNDKKTIIFYEFCQNLKFNDRFTRNY